MSLVEGVNITDLRKDSLEYEDKVKIAEDILNNTEENYSTKEKEVIKESILAILRKDQNFRGILYPYLLDYILWRKIFFLEN